MRASDGGKRAGHRGELEVSRKAIAQGMSDVLRFTCMLMRALLVHIAHEIAGAARIRHSLRPLIFKGAKVTCRPRAQRVARRLSAVIVREGGRSSIPETPMICSNATLVGT